MSFIDDDVMTFVDDDDVMLFVDYDDVVALLFVDDEDVMTSLLIMSSVVDGHVPGGC